MRTDFKKKFTRYLPHTIETELATTGRENQAETRREGGFAGNARPHPWFESNALPAVWLRLVPSVFPKVAVGSGEIDFSGTPCWL